MRLELIEVGQIVNAHGVRGEMKLHPVGGFTPEFIALFKTLYIDGIAMETASRRVHGTVVLVTFPGVTDMDAALRFKGKFVSIRRRDAKLKRGEYFDAELIGTKVLSYPLRQEVGTLKEVLTYPAHKLYLVENEKKHKKYLIPAVQDIFIVDTDIDEGTMLVRMMEGLETDEN
ncbi:MAG: ribosome maturation factor RimM [Oscillospiraceae bacterium]